MAISNRAHLQTRLQNIFSAIDQGMNDPFLYTKIVEKSSSLVLLFDNGIDPDPLYSGTLLGHIFLDEENNLSLASWPNQEEKDLPWRKEILFSHVKSFQFEFLGNKTDLGKNERINPITPNLAWRTIWSKNQKKLPSIIRLTVQEQKEPNPLHFAFILPSSDLFIPYMEKKAL